ncbi:FluC/FEX family fluoride channel [Micromonospora carbonacea]|uniref:Fluoride-specific ion channel FluC n=1 Tax=Micromonospora carbonacea TaxID=47853 RepID=A0A7H8XM44_9ACTN|nr:CrcB family protein [Micromonospora carbonacea]MBB5826345.1 CrcB protein [Micromonospora carbonacea]QLD25884.1 CrcB family protein [Micromonospora carbonacea]
MAGPTPRRVDPDVDLRVPEDRGELRAHPAVVLGVIAAGGVLGALARAGVQAAFPHPPTGFPWATFGVNVSGCLLIGALMAVVTAGRVPPLTRPFLGVGVLGGYTTFSTYVVDVRQAALAGAAGTALAYLVATLLGALAAVWVGDAAAARLLGRATGSHAHPTTPGPAGPDGARADGGPA